MSAVPVRLIVDPNPGATSVAMIKISPHVPSALFGFIPVPHRPGLLRFQVHVFHIPSVVEFSEVRVLAEVALAEIVSDLVASDVAAPDGKSNGEYSSGPAVIVTSVCYGERGEWDCDCVVWSLGSHVVADTKEGKSLGAGLITLEGVAVVAGEASCPIVLIGGEHCRLECESLVEW